MKTHYKWCRLLDNYLQIIKCQYLTGHYTDEDIKNAQWELEHYWKKG